MNKSTFDWQGHRGARGLLPENTIPSFLKALEFGVKTLEMDVVISKDQQVIISHDPWMSADICSHPDGRPVSKTEEEKLLLFQMTTEEIQHFDCGKRGHHHFPEQQPLPAHKPTLSEMIQAVENYCRQNNLQPPVYNIELKSQPEWDNSLTPPPHIFVTLVLNTLHTLGLTERTCLQSFDVRLLQEIKRQDSNIITALLIENTAGVKMNLQRLGYRPEIYSPFFLFLDKKTVDALHQQNMKVIPWTVNDPADMDALIAMGVDGIITDYPNRIEAVTALRSE